VDNERLELIKAVIELITAAILLLTAIIAPTRKAPKPQKHRKRKR